MIDRGWNLRILYLCERFFFPLPSLVSCVTNAAKGMLTFQFLN
jgi:hypothetical protein